MNEIEALKQTLNQSIIDYLNREYDGYYDATEMNALMQSQEIVLGYQKQKDRMIEVRLNLETYTLKTIINDNTIETTNLLDRLDESTVLKQLIFDFQHQDLNFFIHKKNIEKKKQDQKHLQQ